MNAKLLLLFILLAYTHFATGQEGQTFLQISTGAGYGKQVFYDLDSQTGVEVANEDWDLIFTTFGLQDAGIHLNEASSSTFGMPAPGLELYWADTSDFGAVTVFDTTFLRLYNDEASWGAGAINVNRNPQNFLDYGWGVYNPATRQVIGDEVFVLKLRDGSFIKFIIENLDATVYNIKYANLDGSDEKTASIDKANYPGGLAPFSFRTGAVLNLDLSGFDLVFKRYVTMLVDTTDNSELDYPVTGILSGLGVEVAKLENIDPADVTLDSVNNYENRLDIIGWDWKEFSFTDGWVLPQNLSYVVKTNQNKYYQLIFIDFEGSSTGTATVEWRELGIVSSINDPLSVFEDINIFPNPVQGQMNLTYTLKERQNQVRLILSNQLGQQVWNTTTDGLSGLNARSFSLPNLPTGNYFLSIQAGSSLTTRKLNLR